MRVDKIDQVELERQATAIASSGKGGSPIGVLLALTAAVRAIQYKSAQAICVVDDPLSEQPPMPANPAHAVLGSPHSMPEEDAEELRKELLDALRSGDGPIKFDAVYP